MSQTSKLLQSSRLNFYSGMFLAVVWGMFAYAHILQFQKTHELSPLIFCLSETLTAIFFIFRSDPETVSTIPFDWLVAIGGTFAPLFFRPASWGILPLASTAIIAGACIQILALISLNRSFALVAAKRKIKTAWMYRIVRHPIYASYCLIFTGYVLTNTTLANVAIYAVTIGLLCIRIFREERHLALDPQYREYMIDVRYRLIPLIF
ncbi:isoprenylcysteine carboxylmethyltransferase family protein [Pseudomonas cavernae]|uniref:Isoprenylcysteine carboxylmethyltransferase family protein n=1 Tax=Pseudomonas cavernae TaxID=2320867 RepID=A0A385Z292_9PSED|nr:methyltransferase [Pseudomonas cavernae]AYC32610.1 isoprenylcysteine carboxylmethyltransferase family protein [Pseudomonas cavernae]